MNRCTGSIAIGALTVGVWAAGACGAAPSFRALVFNQSDVNSGADLVTDARSVSADGSVVAGHGRVSGPVELFTWTDSGGPVVVGDSGLWVDGDEIRVSGDGEVLIARASEPYKNEYRGARRTASGVWEILVDVASSEVMRDARGVSADGSVVVGTRLMGGGAARWRDGEIEGLGDLPGGAVESEAWGVSADGSVVIGWSRSSNGIEAFRWTEGEGMVGLGDLPGGKFASEARGISADGAVIVGYGTTATGTEAFRWTEAGGLEGLGVWQGQLTSAAIGVSGDGSVIIGSMGSVPFLWTRELGMRPLAEVLADSLGLDLDGITLTWASAISADGATIVGLGRNEFEQNVGWVAEIPSSWCAADVDGDGATAMGDFVAMVSNFGAGPGAARAQGDLTGDGLVNSADFNVLAGNFGCGLE